MSKVTLGGGCAVSPTFLIAFGFPHDVPEGQSHTRLFFLNLESETRWTHVEWPGRECVSACFRPSTAERKREVSFLSLDGYVRTIGPDGDRETYIEGSGPEGTRGLGDLRSIDQFDGTYFACGAGGQVYRGRNGSWSPIDEGLVSEDDLAWLDDPSASIDDVVARSRGTELLTGVGASGTDDVMVCGLSGFVARWDGRSWSDNSMETKSHVYAMDRTRADEVWLVGQDGLLATGDPRTRLAAGGIGPAAPNLYSVARFEGETFLGSRQGLLRHDGQSVEQVRDARTGIGRSTVIEAIDVVDDTMWIIGNRHVFRRGGRRMERFAHPDNED